MMTTERPQVNIRLDRELLTSWTSLRPPSRSTVPS